MNQAGWSLLAGGGLLVGLAALLSATRPGEAPAPAARLVVNVPPAVLWVALTSGALAVALLFVLAFLRDGRKREAQETAERESPMARIPPWLRPIVAMLAVVPYVVLAYVLWTAGIPEMISRLVEQITRLGALADGADAAAGERAEVSSSLYTGAVSVLALAAGLGSLGLLLCLLFAERIARWWTDAEEEDVPAPVVQAVEESLDDVRLEPDPRRAIIKCYRRFEGALARSRVPRAPWQTPLEFMRDALARLPLPPAPVQTLTRLFELSRFSAEPVGAADRDAAWTALLEIQAELGTRDGRALTH